MEKSSSTLETGLERDLDDEQIEAVNLACAVDKRLVGITGEAGTGKTTILAEIHRLLDANGYKVALCAPTGKAAKRIEEATGIKAVTCHKLLEFPKPRETDAKGKALNPGFPQRNASNPLRYDVVLGDEYAMVPNEIHRFLIDALPRGGALRCFGDINQLAPIEENRIYKNSHSPFSQVLREQPSVRLHTLHRQGEGSGIVVNARRINGGLVPDPNPEFRVRITDDPVDTVRKIVQWGIDNGVDFSSPRHQIITQTNKGFVGTYRLNEALQGLFQTGPTAWLEVPRKVGAPSRRLRLAVGDKIIWTENNYDLNIFNGETGEIVDINFDDGSFDIDFLDRIVHIPPIISFPKRNGQMWHYDPRESVDLAYVITTHKSQGSEYDWVMYLMNKSTSWLQSRRNFYTGVTRAKSKLLCVTDAWSLRYSVATRRARADAKR